MVWLFCFGCAALSDGVDPAGVTEVHPLSIDELVPGGVNMDDLAAPFEEPGSSVATIEVDIEVSEPVAIDDAVGQAELYRLARQKSGQLVYCAQALAEVTGASKMDGDLVVTVSVAAGKMVQTQLDSNTMPLPDVGGCAIGKIRRWKAPHEINGSFRLSFRFTSSS